MTRSEMIRAIAIKTDLNQTQAREALEAFVEILAWAASEGEDTTITGLGRFIVKDRPERLAMNPATGEKVVVPERRSISFRASPAFKNRI